MRYSEFLRMCLLLCFLSEGSLAQSNFSSCERLVQKKKVDKAIRCYEEQLVKNNKDIKVLCRLTELYYEKRDIPKTKSYAKGAIESNAEKAYDPLFYLARKMSFRRDNATAIYVIDLLGNNINDKTRRQKLGALKNSYLLQKYELNGPKYNVTLTNLGDSVNSTEAEYLPSLSLDGNTMVFTRRVNGANEDFFIAERDTSRIWGKAQNLGYPPNTGFPDGAAKLSADGNYLFFTRCDMRSANGIERGGCDLVFCYRTGRKKGKIIWSPPQYFKFTINTPAYEGQPCLSSDNKDLYFVSDREGGYGGKDIYVSHFNEGFWSIPENLGPTINTSGDETTPFIHPDNETLYFASDGHPTLGETDVFVSRKINNQNWQQAVNLGAPINSRNIDGGVSITAKGDHGYIASNRTDSRGKLDIYKFNLYNGIKPIPTLCVKGQVLNKKTLTTIKEQEIIFTRWPDQLPEGSISSNKGDGSYTQALHTGRQYLMSVKADGFRPFHKILDLRQDTFPDNYFKNIRLKQPGLIDTLGKYRLAIDTNNKLRTSAIVQLDYIFSKIPEWLDDSASVKIYINTNYYYGDDEIDSNAHKNFYDRLKLVDFLRETFYLGGVPKVKMIFRHQPYIWRDESAELDFIELNVVEFY